MTPRNLIFAMVTMMGIRHSKANALREASYEILESLLRDPRRQVCNEDLHTELDNYNEEYDNEREMEPRPARMRETTHVLRTGSSRVRRHRGKVKDM
nr:hypothetical protein [Tanacetum cinerariifolium]